MSNDEWPGGTVRTISVYDDVSQRNRPTPHPGPLPFEGRGGATSAVPGAMTLAAPGAAFPRVVEQLSPGAAALLLTRRSPHATPSPLNGERPG